jgi:DNA-3-methyladenine glycosylase II
MEWQRSIVPAGPFRLASSLTVLKPDSAAQQPPTLDAGYNFSVEIPGGAVEVQVHQAGPGQPIDLRIFGEDADDSAVDGVVEAVRRRFHLHVEAGPFFELASEDPHLRKAAAILPDLRPALYLTPFEGLISAILGYRRSPRDTSMLLSNLREVCGVVPKGRPYASPAFPGKYTLLAAPEQLLKIAGLSHLLSRSVTQVVGHLVGDPDPLEEIAELDDPRTSLKQLVQLPGVNHSVGLHMLQHAFGYPDLLLESPQLKRAVKRFYNLPDLPDILSLERLSAPFEGWKSWWSYLLVNAHRTSVVA